MGLKFIWGFFLAVFLASNFLITACDPVPGSPLNTSQKIEDMGWLFSRFEKFYAPLQYKLERYGLNFEKLKLKYLELAVQTKSNDEFYMVMQKFVAEFRDAHTGLVLTPSSLPGRARIAFLGISGERIGNQIIVKEVLPTIDPVNYPIKVGDKITKINGKSIMEYMDENIIPYRNVGNPDSNYTFLAGALFTRSSLSFPIPKESMLELTYLPAKKLKFEPSEQKIKLPWIIQDLQDFKQQIAAANSTAKDKKSTLWLPIQTKSNGELVEIALLNQNGKPLSVGDVEQMVGGNDGLLSSYKLISIGGWTANKKKIQDEGTQTPFEKLKEERPIPDSAIPLVESVYYPAYVFSEPTINKNGKPTGQKKLEGYIRIADFESPADSVGELVTILNKFQSLGVKKITVDTLSNPGGSLELVMKVAQTFSNKKLKMPGQQFGLSDWWLDNIHTEALSATGAQQEMYMRLYKSLRSEFEEGKKLSRIYNMSELMPYGLNPNYNLKKNFEITVLVNEMNASCGDIFPLILQENKMATIKGKRTMGAGGNVDTFIQAPNSNADLRQTLSLVVKKDGTYLENNGVTPDVVVDYTDLFYKIALKKEKQEAIKEALSEGADKNAKNCGKALANLSH